MRLAPALFLACAVGAGTGWLPSAAAQTRTVASGSRVQAERAAVDLRQGMTLQEVEQLLGKPWRTALTSSGSAAGAPWQGTLRWTYIWVRSSSASAAERSLNIDFAAKTAEQWYVNGWNWSSD
jgi:hypothetical protein